MANLLRISYTERKPINFAPDKLVVKEAIVNLDLVDFINTETNIMYTEYGKQFELTQDTMNKINALTIGIY